jgi:Adenylate and Guanylate cyclase catalytic domain
MEADEAGTLETLRRYRAAMATLIERHDGRIVNTWGDAVIAEFPSVVEAVQCAVETQQELSTYNGGLPEPRRMRFRIGIHLGDVMVCRVGRVECPRGLIAAWVCACCAQRKRPAVALTKPSVVRRRRPSSTAPAFVTHLTASPQTQPKRDRRSTPCSGFVTSSSTHTPCVECRRRSRTQQRPGEC